MFESTVEAQGLHESERKFGAMSVAALAHVGIGLAILAVTALIVPPVKLPEPPPPPVVITSGRILLDDSSPRLASAPKKGSETPKASKAILTPPVPEAPTPHETTDAPPITTPVDPPSGPDGDGSGPKGVPNGSLTGVPDGTGPGDGGPGGGGTGDPVPLSGDMQKPVLLEKIEPEYPIVARRAGLGGRVTLQAVIAPDGSVESVEVLASINPIFNRAAVDAVRRWRYRPALMNGSPVRVYFTVVVDFVVR